jgi:hypothetical protein
MKLAVPPRTPDTGGLWLLTIAPTIWAVHLLLCYITAAIWCAKFATPGASLDAIRAAIFWYTAVSLAGIAGVGWEGFRRHNYASTALRAGPSTALRAGGTEATTHDLDTPEDRHRFLGFATLLLAGLSAVAVLYAALAATFFDTCT